MPDKMNNLILPLQDHEYFVVQEAECIDNTSLIDKYYGVLSVYHD